MTCGAVALDGIRRISERHRQVQLYRCGDSAVRPVPYQIKTPSAQDPALLARSTTSSHEGGHCEPLRCAYPITALGEMVGVDLRRAIDAHTELGETFCHRSMGASTIGAKERRVDGVPNQRMAKGMRPQLGIAHEDTGRHEPVESLLGRLEVQSRRRAHHVPADAGSDR